MQHIELLRQVPNVRGPCFLRRGEPLKFFQSCQGPLRAASRAGEGPGPQLRKCCATMPVRATSLLSRKTEVEKPVSEPRISEVEVPAEVLEERFDNRRTGRDDNGRKRSKKSSIQKRRK